MRVVQFQLTSEDGGKKEQAPWQTTAKISNRAMPDALSFVGASETD